MVIPTFVFVSGMKVAQQYRDYDQFLSVVSSSRHESMVGGALVTTSTLRAGLGVSGATIVSGSYTRPSNSWISYLLTSSLSLGTSSLFCRTTQCISVRMEDSSTLGFSLSSHRLIHKLCI